jgi:hypothetical protein
MISDAASSLPHPPLLPEVEDNNRAPTSNIDADVEKQQSNQVTPLDQCKSPHARSSNQPVRSAPNRTIRAVFTPSTRIF